LCEGEVAGTTVTCPWHGTSDLKTGAALGLPATQGVKRYQVTVKGNDILLSA
jgi:nitrite reductase/ring-hydroxylating ferredoxin subunit